jgi:hypothetical protein
MVQAIPPQPLFSTFTGGTEHTSSNDHKNVPFPTNIEAITNTTSCLTQFQQWFLGPRKLVCHRLCTRGLPPLLPVQSLPVSRTWFHQDIHTPGTKNSQQSGFSPSTIASGPMNWGRKDRSLTNKLKRNLFCDMSTRTYLCCFKVIILLFRDFAQFCGIGRCYFLSLQKVPSLGI